MENLGISLDLGHEVKLIDYINGTLIPDTWYHVNIPLENLNMGTRFYTIVFWLEYSGNVHYYLDDISLEWIEDPNPPVISNVTVTDITERRTNIAWQTDEYSNSTINYNAGDINVSIDLNEDYSKEHNILITNLSTNTTYNFSIISKDHQANASYPQNIAQFSGEFTTNPDLPPVISNVSITDIRSNRAAISWTTNEISDSGVYYGENDYSSIKTDNSLTTSHRVVITGLKPETSYQYKVVSRDEAGNPAEYEDTSMNFTTSTILAATLRVDGANNIHPFSADIRGVNFAPWEYYYDKPYPNDSPKLRELTKLIKPGVIRAGGGLLSNDLTWNRNNTQLHPGQWIDSNGDDIKDRISWRDFYEENDYETYLRVGYDRCHDTDPTSIEKAYRSAYQANEIDNISAFAKYVGADLMMGVDITTCDPELWADMVNYANVEHNYNIKYWELGNELDLERLNGKSDIPIGQEYVSRYKKYYRAMKAKDNNISIVGPTTAANENDTYWRAYLDFIDPLTLDVEIQQNKMLDVLSYHNYPLYSRPSNVMSYKDMFAYTFYDPIEGESSRNRSREHMNSIDKRELLDNRGLPDTKIAVTEFNSIVTVDVTTAYTINHANALYMADTLARQAYSGVDMILHWVLYGQQNTKPGEIYGNGLIDRNGSRNFLGMGGEQYYDDYFTPMPVYYTYFMYAQLFGDMLVQSSSSMEDKLSIWASTDSAEPNTLKLMVVNLADESINASLDLNVSHVSGGRYYELSNTGFVTAEDKGNVLGGTNINGLEIDSSSAQSIIDSAKNIIDSGIPISNPGNSLNHVFPAYTATVFILNTTQPSVTNATANHEIPDDTDNQPLWGETAQLNVTVVDENANFNVTVNLSQIGGSSAQPMENIDGNIYSTTTNVSAGTPPGLYNLKVNATNIYGNSNTSVTIQLRVMRNGDCTGNDVVNIGDALRLANNVSYPWNPLYALSSPYVCEVTGNGIINIGDALRLANNVSYPGNMNYILK